MTDGFFERVFSDVRSDERNRYAMLLLMVGAAAIIFTFVFMAFAQLGGRLGAVGVGGLIVLVGISIGGLLGFLFSVPRVLAKDTPPPALPLSDAVATRPSIGALNTAVRRERLLSSNTNLERISEWLTTMLVGVGLTQIGSVDKAFSQFSDFLRRRAMVFSDDGYATAGVLPAVGPFLLVCGLVSGFIFFYIYTRIYLSPLFQRVEVLLSDPEGETLEVGVSDFNAAAASLADAATLAEEPEDLWISYASRAPDMSIDDSLSVIQELLYKPEGYARAIELGSKLVDTPAVKTARYWYLMAAANGQKHHKLKETGASEKDRLSTRRAVINATRKAVRLNSNYKWQLLDLTNPNAYDNDLQDFADDKDFKAIVR
ncbi:hypothetical protein [Rhizobium sp. Rhizsp42]|uniref:hypothetical protein n=1 Tax=Rhizobium sp. Rhizsp42 TaxID=3243034 RepID=UPI0039B0B70F